MTTRARSAVLSPCGRYRYQLERTNLLGGLFGGNTGRVLWVMLNPSTADAVSDDNTVRKITTFTRAWGFDGLTVANLFAFRATDPKHLSAVDNPVGPENDRILGELAADPAFEMVVCAWGAHGVYLGRGETVRRQLADAGRSLHHLGLTAGGQPRHPLYLSGSTVPEVWR